MTKGAKNTNKEENSSGMIFKKVKGKLRIDRGD